MEAGRHRSLGNGTSVASTSNGLDLGVGRGEGSPPPGQPSDTASQPLGQLLGSVVGQGEVGMNKCDTLFLQWSRQQQEEGFEVVAQVLTGLE